eukprot:GSChrysophyteH1.ASY1.ANO1.3291.1 assembled CDS
MKVAWNATDGLMKWEISPDEFQQMKAVQPKMKLHIMVHAASGDDKAEAGYALIDLRDLGRGEIKQQAFKTHRMPNGLLTISCRATAGSHVSRHPTKVLDDADAAAAAGSGGGGAQAGGLSVVSSLAASTDSVRSVLRLALGKGPAAPAGAAAVRFSLAVTLQDYHYFNALCEKVVKADQEACRGSDYGARQDAADAARERSFWLCWTVFDKMFQSTEFAFGQVGPKRVKDTIRVECPLQSIQDVIREHSPLRVFLCTQGQLLAVADIPLPAMTADSFLGDEDEDTVPVLSAEGWATFSSDVKGLSKDVQPLQPVAPNDVTVAAVKISVDVTFDSIIGGEDDSTTGGAPAAAEEEYDADDFETEEKSAHVHFADEGNPQDGAEQAPDLAPPPPTASRPEGFHEEGTEGEGESNGMHDDEDDEVNLRHFRVSVDVKSIGGFKRPAQVSVLFSYPHLGSSSPVRTSPVWVLANSEVRIDGGVASYECVMTRANIRAKLRDHPLKINCNSRSNLGSASLGECLLDLSATNATNPMHYRCPTTGKNFKTRADYSRHRQTLLTLHAAGRLSTPAPPVDPVYVRVTDSFIHVQGSDGTAQSGKIRAVVVIEDMGIVGSKQAVPVRLGYSQHGAGVYVSEDQEQSLLDADDVNASSTQVRNPLEDSGANMTPMERKRLEMMQMEWEGWRRQAEQEWRDLLAQKETALRKRLESEAAASLANRADDLRRAHEEAGRLEVRLRTAIDSAERQNNALELKKEQMNLKLAQKTGELQLLQKRVRDEAKTRIDAEKNRADSLASQLGACQIDLARMEKRAKESEKEYETYRHQTKALPENVLREELARLKAQLAETRAEIERERRVRSEAELEKEHYRSQMHRLALALKREREKSNTMARQELEQLRLEFLAREERYVLDGDREELRTIRHELASLRSGGGGLQVSAPPAPPTGAGAGAGASKHAREQVSALLSTGLYSESDSIIAELRAGGAE